MPSHEWDNMGKQDFSCQMWLEQGGGGREGIVSPLAICRGTEVTRGSNPPSWGCGGGEGGGGVKSGGG